MEGVNLQRRITRQVKGRPQQLAAICHPAFADLALSELQHLGIMAAEQSPGVLICELRIEGIYQVHLQSRFISSFRLRLMEFRCGSREDLFHKLRNFPWEYWLQPHLPFHIRLTRKASRISHDGRALDSARKGVAGRIKEVFGETQTNSTPPVGAETQSAQKIFIYLSGTRALVSLDASGELLYKRGYSLHQASAPLRENLAAAIIAAAPFSITQPLIDAMSGSGSFLGEGILSCCDLWPIPQRSFAFENWPVFNPASLNIIRKRLATDNARNLSAMATRVGDDALKAFYAVESDPQIYALLEQNLTRFSQNYLGQHRITLVNQDFFTWINRQSLFGQHSGTILCNPPYGWRIPRQQGSYAALWHIFLHFLPHWQGIILMPLNESRRLVFTIPPAILQRSTHRDFPHGGRWIRALYIRAIPV